jgi:hypothetical protein
MNPAELLADLTDLFDVAISDSLDIDWGTIDGARACAAALLSDSAVLAALAKVAP